MPLTVRVPRKPTKPLTAREEKTLRELVYSGMEYLFDEIQHLGERLHPAKPSTLLICLGKDPNGMHFARLHGTPLADGQLPWSIDYEVDRAGRSPHDRAEALAFLLLALRAYAKKHDLKIIKRYESDEERFHRLRDVEREERRQEQIRREVAEATA